MVRLLLPVCMNVETPTFHVSKSDEGYFLEDSMLTYVDRIGTLCYHNLCRTVTKWISRTTDVNFWTKIFFSIVDQTEQAHHPRVQQQIYILYVQE